MQINVKLNEKGAALIAGLLILVVLSILGITTMQSSLLQERMAGNMEQRDVAFELAEAGLRHGEAWLNNLIVIPPANNNSTGVHPDSVGLHGPTSTSRPLTTSLLRTNGDRDLVPLSRVWREADTWTQANHRVYDPDDINPDPPIYQMPRYFIEFVTEVDASGSDSLKFGAAPEDLPGMYRITSRGVSPNGRSVVILQTTFLR